MTMLFKVLSKNFALLIEYAVFAQLSLCGVYVVIVTRRGVCLHTLRELVKLAHFVRNIKRNWKYDNVGTKN
jgi:hypothetical protein